MKYALRLVMGPAGGQSPSRHALAASGLQGRGLQQQLVVGSAAAAAAASMLQRVT
jgi:hypothetical protein